MKLQQTFAIIASLVVVTCASTIADVLADLHSKTTALTHTLNAFPITNNGILTAVGIHHNVVNLISAIEKGTSIVNGVPKPISATDADKVVTEAQALEPSILHCLGAVISKKPDFIALPFPTGSATVQIKQDLTNLSASVLKLEAALMASAPADLLTTGKSIEESINSAFAKAITAYS